MSGPLPLRTPGPGSSLGGGDGGCFLARTHPCGGGRGARGDVVPGSWGGCEAASKAGGHWGCAAWGDPRVLPCSTWGEGNCGGRSGPWDPRCCCWSCSRSPRACYGRACFPKGPSSSRAGGSRRRRKEERRERRVRPTIGESEESRLVPSRDRDLPSKRCRKMQLPLVVFVFWDARCGKSLLPDGKCAPGRFFRRWEGFGYSQEAAGCFPAPMALRKWPGEGSKVRKTIPRKLAPELLPVQP